MPFRIITAGKDIAYYSCICERCGYSPEPIMRGKDWASTVDQEVRRALRARGWNIDDDDRSWCALCSKGMERAIATNIESQRSVPKTTLA